MADVVTSQTIVDTAGRITNNATNTTATSGDLELTALGTSGFVIIELRKDIAFTA